MSLFSNRPQLSRARRRALMKRRYIVIGAAVLVLALLIALIVHFTRGGSDDPAKPAAPAATQKVETPIDTEAPDESEDEPTEAPATSAPTPAPADTAARAASRPAPYGDGFLPVFKSAATQEKIIAITVDDCNEAENLRAIVDCALENGAKLTIFPTGANALKPQQAEILKIAWENGFELENHTFDHNNLYRSPDEELSREVYMQQMALSHILGVNYQPHFLRPAGGDAVYDQRVHKYIEQLGYIGLAHWSHSANVSNKKLAKALTPGAIILAHTKDKDADKLTKFIPWAIQQGYQLVTLNEMFGYAPNETSPLEGEEPNDRTPPPPEPYETVYSTLKKPSYSWLVYRLQQKLIAMGYLEGQPDGVYGDGCVKAVMLYQRDHGLKETGVVEADLLKKLLEE